MAASPSHDSQAAARGRSVLAWAGVLVMYGLLAQMVVLSFVQLPGLGNEDRTAFALTIDA